MTEITRFPRRNRLLAALNPADRARLAPHLVEQRLETNQVLYEPGAPITHIYFPHSSVISLIVVAANGSSVEAATIGNEGVVGLGGLLAGDVSFTRQLVQLPGRAGVLDRQHVLEVVHSSRSLRESLSVHTDDFVAQILQSAACHALHGVEKRLARWLLQMDDRWEGPEMPMTQEALGAMLGVRRSTVTLAANVLQAANLITYRRGRIIITNRAGLEEMACECYGIVKQLQESHFVAAD